MHHAIADRASFLWARARGLAETAGARMPDLHDETGAQAAEYAMLAGVSAATCGGLVIVIQASDLLPGLLGTIMNAIGGLVASWF